VDLNADVGEGFDTDEALLAIVTSANVACGFHAGSPETMRQVSALALERGVAIGAHVSYRDREGFGRRDLDVAPHVVREEVAVQVAALREATGDRVAYVKPHGALYHRAGVDAACAEALVRAAAAAGGLPLLGLPGSQLLQRAEAAGHEAVVEAFADRGYATDGSLLPRGSRGAILEEEEAVKQAVRLAGAAAARSICVHGDSPGAARLARRVRRELEAAGFDVRSFA
jgi:UPF0271 protein